MVGFDVMVDSVVMMDLAVMTDSVVMMGQYDEGLGCADGAI